MNEQEQVEEGDAETAAAARAALAELALTEMRCPFGPRFFLEQLAAFVRDRCPDPTEHLPRVELWVHGEPIMVCHVIALAPQWIALAARGEGDEARMRTECIPYAAIARVTIGRAASGTRSMGFDLERQPLVIDAPQMSPEEAISAAARRPTTTRARP